MGRSSAVAPVLACVLASTGCIAAGARLQGGVVANGDRLGAQVGVSFAFGITRNAHAAVVGNVGFATGTAPKAGLIDMIEYVHVPGEDAAPVIVRGGLGGVINLAGNPGLVGVHAAAVFVVRDRGSSYEGHEKFGGGGWSRSLYGVGVEARAGLASTRLEGATPEETTSRTRAGGSLMATVEWLTIGQSSFF